MIGVVEENFVRTCRRRSRRPRRHTMVETPNTIRVRSKTRTAPQTSQRCPRTSRERTESIDLRLKDAIKMLERFRNPQGPHRGNPGHAGSEQFEQDARWTHRRVRVIASDHRCVVHQAARGAGLNPRSESARLRVGPSPRSFLARERRPAALRRSSTRGDTPNGQRRSTTTPSRVHQGLSSTRSAIGCDARQSPVHVAVLEARPRGRQ